MAQVEEWGCVVVLPAPPLAGQGAAQAWSRGTLQLIRKRRPPCLDGGSRRLACRVWERRLGPPDISDTPALGQWCLTGRAPGPGENTTPIEDSARGTGERAAPASYSMKLSIVDPLMMVTGIGPDTGDSLGSTNQCPENPSGGVCFIAGVDTPRCRCRGTGGGVGVRGGSAGAASCWPGCSPGMEPRNTSIDPQATTSMPGWREQASGL
ncbi:hypothetical protein ACOMHN_060785 [Nucella lapillus]